MTSVCSDAWKHRLQTPSMSEAHREVRRTKPSGGLSFGSVSPQGYFLGQLAKLPSQRLWPNKDQFAGSELEQPKAGLQGEYQGWSS
jgi:hypothetical protein